MRRVSLLLALALAACGDDLRPAPVVFETADVRVTVWEAPARIEIVRVGDGEIIFDGMPGGPGGAPTAPRVAAAFRTAQPSIETQVGAFRIEDDTVAPWRGAPDLEQARATDDGVAFAIAGPGGARLGVGRITVTATDGQPEVVIALDAADPSVNRTSLAYRCADGEHFLGLGGQSFDVDQRGQTVPLWVEEDGISKRDDDEYEGVWFLTGRRHSTHTPMPMFLSSRGYAAAVATDARAVFAMCSEPDAATGDAVRLEAWSPHLELHLWIPRADPADPRVALAGALAGMTGWVGRPTPPPAFTWAPWLDAIYGSANVRRVAQRLRDEDVPTSVIWTEDWRGGNDEATGYVLEEDWRVDRDLYPDFESVADDLHAAGYKFLTYANTFVDSQADVYDEVLARDYGIHDATGAPYLFTGVKFRPATLLDLTNPAAVAWASEVFREAMTLGSDGWMADFGEWLPHDAALASGEDPMLAHNRYPVEWARLDHALFADQQARDGVDRLYFMRSAWLGSQPLVQVMWAGDQQTDFSAGDGLRSVIPILLGLGVTGFPYVGHDIAGYMSQLTVPSTKELWFRWCELGALSPVMRTHHGRAARDDWSWESDDESVAHLRRWARVHMGLAWYLETLAARAAETGAPIMRPVALGYPDEPWAWSTTDEYLLGDRILVAPVLDEGATARDVALPAGTWVPLLGGAAIAGGGTVTVDAPVTELPAFVPAGALLSLYPDRLDTLAAATDPGVVTRADVGEDRIYAVYPGVAADPRVASTDEGDLADTWTGCPADAPAPTTAVVDGFTVPVTAGPGYVAVPVVTTGGTSTVELAGGTLTIRIAPGATATSEVRLMRGP